MGADNNDTLRKFYKELLYYLNREYKKLHIVFNRIRFVGDHSDVWKLVLSYWEDCKYFYNKHEYIKAFELINYIWGMLDILANLNMLELPNDIKKWFKVEQG